MNTPRRQFLGLAGGLLAGGLSQTNLFGQDPQWTKPVHRVANAALSSQKADATAGVSSAKADLVRGLDMARQSLTRSKTEVKDYTALLVKRERIGDSVGDHEYMRIKVRNRKEANGRLVQPFSVYLAFVKPTSVKGREVIYVENQNNGNIVAHEGGFKGRFLPTVSIPPTGMLAMRGQRYPMTEIGVENMILKLIERGEKALQFEDVHAEIRKEARLQNRPCTVLQLTQPTRRPDAEFHTAQVFMDNELNMPIRYIAHDWPTAAGGRGEVIEEYNYLNLEVNVGLTDKDFDPYNKDYNFHS
ncbi:DUF1571 domain-containing protein [Rhodopirellula bahusiensis]|uniref:DUF1571 domain-containing protein n=1 Tax=Rhodopirellula bahusiensis TaxID=2014065 RepID=A0A2G1W1H5_9BACT|nr:DUF1571 domain-containing protein [Rhodopirellula bahusiensis]PHQ32835.1 hypothetical protein CEE69_23950 [Rhodopirellula bahusiensis]